MAYTVTVVTKDNKKTEEKDVNDVSFQGDFMILCLIDLKTRVVKNLHDIDFYKIVEQPIEVKGFRVGKDGKVEEK